MLDDRARHLERVPLFANLEPGQLAALAQVTTTRRLRPREELFHKGDEGSQVYVVVSGRLKVVTTGPEGNDIVFGIMEAGEVVGELPLLAGGPRTASVNALEECELLVLDRRDFLRFLKAHPDAAVNLLAVLAERLMRASELVEDTMFLRLPARLAKKLLALAETFGEEEGSDIVITLRLNQADLGNMIGTTRESVNKQMRAWSKSGVLSMARGEIRIHCMQELERLGGLVFR
jgi:CRP/FNR family cyclic AMP-dependent transcriptional regulator